MKSLKVFFTGLTLTVFSAGLFGQQSTVYISVLSTKLFVVGAANPETGLYYKKTGDTVWNHTGAKNIRAFGLAVHTPYKGSLICIASGNGVHRSTDGGATWRITTGWEITEVLSVVIDQSDPNFMLCTTPYGVHRTLDGGITWKECNNGIKEKFASSVVIDHENNKILYCGTEDGVYRSENMGESWQRTGLGVSGVRVVVQNPKDPNTLVAGTDDHGIYVTRNAGKYWEKTEAGLDHLTFYAIAYDPTNPQVLYAGGYVTGVYKSSDGGLSWTRKNEGLTNLNIHSLAVDPTNGSRVFVGTQWSGVFQSDNAGDTWRNIGLNGSQVWTISVQPF
ncbi:MAG TPA: hypothetical protein DEP53_11950 [Bacteroidetes bacterium]|nr:hypothetical protein [Bacteroidota bacterium]